MHYFLKMKKVSTSEATKILKEIIKKAHIESKHSGTGSRLKSIFGLQKTSIGMFLDSILSQYEKYASKKEFEEVQEFINMMYKRSDIWDNYQRGGDYPATFEYLLLIIMKTLTGKEPEKKILNLAQQKMYEEIDK